MVKVKVKVGHSMRCLGKQRVEVEVEVEVISNPFATRAKRRWVVSTTLRPLYPPQDPVPIFQEAGWAPGPDRTVQKFSPPPWFDPRTVDPVASRYTD
jgi:hypothetical protein